MYAHIHHDTLDMAVGGPPTFSELFELIGHGSDATALDELPRSVLRLLSGPGIDALVHMLHQLSTGTPSHLLNAVLHLPLKKREPSWLLANSRPVLLEPYLRRLEASIVFRRQQRRLELLRAIPSSTYAYRRQISPQQAALVARILLTAWTTRSPIYVLDWDQGPIGLLFIT